MVPVALTIAGSDSGGGAGIQADLKTFHAFGTSALTAVTAQNTTGVFAARELPAQLVREQIEAVATDLAPRAVKTGMLASAGIVSCVAEALAAHGLEGGFVLDPVMVATSGDPLLARGAEEALAGELLPLAAIVTPNLAEAARLTGSPVESLGEMRDAARALVEMGAGAALVKGGHLGRSDDDKADSALARDLLWDGSRELVWSRPRIAGGPFHGTGCTLAAATAAGLALGDPLDRAVDRAIAYVSAAMAAAPELGAGARPINHAVGLAP